MVNYHIENIYAQSLFITPLSIYAGNFISDTLVHSTSLTENTILNSNLSLSSKGAELGFANENRGAYGRIITYIRNL